MTFALPRTISTSSSWTVPRLASVKLTVTGCWAVSVLELKLTRLGACGAGGVGLGGGVAVGGAGRVGGAAVGGGGLVGAGAGGVGATGALVSTVSCSEPAAARSAGAQAGE